MSFSSIDEIKNRLDIVEVISSYIKLQKTGANFRALCPFHSEKKPSFFVSPSRQIWHCFGCGAGGDIFKFIMQIEGVEFGDALRTLAQKAGVELKPMKPELKTERQRLYEICELATRFFEKQLEASKIGQEVKKYLLDRGINEESIEKWRIGYAPDNWQGLSDFLVSKGYKKEEVVKAGLAITKDIRENSRDMYDRFRGRIIFPIFDLNSQVVGFGGRVFKEKDKAEIAKYVNTPNTLLYDKSRILYGLDKAKIEIRKKDACILVEGYTDVIMAHQSGTPNIVATSGTALTPYQLKILKRYSENLILGFDMDVAGDSATKRGIDLAQNLGFNLKVIRLPEAKGASRNGVSLPPKDAADIISEDPKKWLEALENLKSILEFYFQSAFSDRDPKTPEGKKEISKILLPALKKIPNKIEQSHWIQELARRLGGREEDIREELKKVPPTTFGIEAVQGEPSDVKSGEGQKSRRELLEERLVTLILKMQEGPEGPRPLSKRINLSDHSGRIEGGAYGADLNLISDLTLFSEPIKEILVKLKSPTKENFVGDEMFNYLSLKAEIEELEKENILPEIKFCLKEIKSLKIKNKLDEISLEIKKAEEKCDLKKIEELTQEFNQIINKYTNDHE